MWGWWNLGLPLFGLWNVSGQVDLLLDHKSLMGFLLLWFFVDSDNCFLRHAGTPWVPFSGLAQTEPSLWRVDLPFMLMTTSMTSSMKRVSAAPWLRAYLQEGVVEICLLVNLPYSVFPTFADPSALNVCWMTWDHITPLVYVQQLVPWGEITVV
jgi:hypothetical protein